MSRYALYLNDLSPVSVHNTSVQSSYIFLDDTKYTYLKLLDWSENRTLVLKYPYLRRSYSTDREVSDIIKSTLPDTAILAVASILIATIFGIVLGIFAALNRGSFFDNSSLVFAVLGMSAPSYLSGIIIAWIGGSLWTEVTSLPVLPFFFLMLGLVFGVILQKKKKSSIGSSKKILWGFLLEMTVKWFLLGVVIWLLGVVINGLSGSELIPGISVYTDLPGTGLEGTGVLAERDEWTREYRYHWDRLILPAITLGIRPLAIVMQLTRSSMLDVISQDYVRTAKAKGVSSFRVIFKHTLKNALNPVVTAVSGWFASLLAGAVFVERVFDWDGIGNQLVISVLGEDLPVAMGITLVIAVFFVLINILVDVLYGFLDPRVRIR
ncbi:MAG TPA: ABC transporter permease [Flavobacteriales bacterium]|nr:ABC transporter permease [Crocinitomicaceae bacterium]HAE31827.1 ABC transporter permease [Flavobacteriales bacterium]